MKVTKIIKATFYIFGSVLEPHRESRSFPLVCFPKIWAIKNPKITTIFHIFSVLKNSKKKTASPQDPINCLLLQVIVL
jgi:hypothetical protein